jgi:hypothetical protein
VRGILFVLLVAVGCVAVALWRQLEASRSQIADMQLRLDSQGTSRQAGMPAASLSASPPVHFDPSESPSAPERVLPPHPLQYSAPVTMRPGPEDVERSRLLFRAQLSTQYPDVGKALDLSPDTVGQLFDLLARQDVDRRRELAAGPAAGESADQAFGRRIQSNEAELSSLLGDKYSQWREYKRELPVRQQVMDLKAVLDAGGIPLADARANSLRAALITTQKELDKERAAALVQAGGKPIPRYSPEGNLRLVDTASGHLSPQQLDAYREMLERQTSRERAMLGGGN